MPESPETTLARQALRILAALQSDGGIPLMALRSQLRDLHGAAEMLLDEDAAGATRVLRWSANESDVAIADAIASPPPRYVPGNAAALFDPSLGITDEERFAAMEACAKLQDDETTPPDVDLAAQRINHHLSGETLPFRPAPRLT